MSIKTIANTILKRHRYNGVKKSYKNLYKRILLSNQFDYNEAKTSETEWLEKWRKYDSTLSPISYRIFSRYIGEDLNIMPLEIQKGIVEPVLTPQSYSSYYNDKNVLDYLFYDLTLPQTLERNINGVCYDKDYVPITDPLAFMKNSNKPERIIVKPSKESSGRGVKLFVWDGDKYVDSESNCLTIDFLNKQYVQNYLIQKAVTQSSYMAQFNASSVNTLRIATYRSVKNGEIHVINAFMRIGASGSCVDNAHAGGMFVGVNKADGVVGKYACDFLGRKEAVFNGIDFGQKEYRIPCWDKVCSFACTVSKRIIQHHLVALDIALDENDNPVLIEVNIGGFGGWAFQFTTSSIFEEYTDEIMDYCYKKYQKLETVTILR